MTTETDKEKILRLGRNSISAQDYDVLYETAKGSNLVVEIGARYGCSSMLFGKIAKRVISIECDPQPEWGENIREMGLYNVSMLQGYSPWIYLKEDIDYFFIDGDHRTMLCIADYVHLMPFVKVGGKIAFHDTEHTDNGSMVRRAVDIIVEESQNLREIARNPFSPGTIVFEKTEAFGGKKFN